MLDDMVKKLKPMPPPSSLVAREERTCSQLHQRERKV
jgi:hypothetical protein